MLHWQKSRSGKKASSSALLLSFRTVKQHRLNKSPILFGGLNSSCIECNFNSPELTINSASSLNIKTSIILYLGYFCYATWAFPSVMNKSMWRWHQSECSGHRNAELTLSCHREKFCSWPKSKCYFLISHHGHVFIVPERHKNMFEVVINCKFSLKCTFCRLRISMLTSGIKLVTQQHPGTIWWNKEMKKIFSKPIPLIPNFCIFYLTRTYHKSPLTLG